MTKAESKQWKKWVKSRPEVVQELIKKYPPGEYIVNLEAPYGVSCGGTTVHLIGYNEEGTVIIIVKAENKLTAAIEHEDELGRKHNRTLEDIEKIHKMDIQVYVDPQYLTLIKSSLHEEIPKSRV